MKQFLKTIAMIMMISLVFAGCTTNVTPEASTSEPVEQTTPDTTENIQEPEPVEVQREQGEMTQEEIQEESLQLAIEDGTYTETVTYSAPPGTEEINMEIEVQDNVITSLSIEGVNSHPTSQTYKERSEQGLQDLLIGKNINEVEVPDKISGSSLTTKAFKEKYEELIQEY